MKKYVLLLAFLALIGCKTRPILPTYSLQTLPPVGTVATAGIGERLLIQGDASTVDAIVIPSDLTFGDVIVRKGTYPQSSENEEYRQFKNVDMERQGRRVKSPHLFLFNKDKSTQTVCINRKTCTDAAYSIGRATSYAPSRTQQTLIYSGKIGNRITLGYREFKDEFARPAFSNDVAYDLSESTVLGYKGARLEVVKATNTEITYKIIAGFD
jgi:hypothetical protein